MEYLPSDVTFSSFDVLSKENILLYSAVKRRITEEHQGKGSIRWEILHRNLHPERKRLIMESNRPVSKGALGGPPPQEHEQAPPCAQRDTDDEENNK